MRIGELSRDSGVTIPTIKYYLREGLLPPGAPAGRNQASYDQSHLERLRLIRALRDVGGLSVTAAKEVLDALDEPELSAHELMGRAHQAVLRDRGSDALGPEDHEWTRARADAAAEIAQLGWRVDPDAPALDQLADVILTLRRVNRPDLLNLLPQYAAATLGLANQEVRLAAADREPAAVMTTVVTGTILGEALLATVRLLAQEHVSATLAEERGEGCEGDGASGSDAASGSDGETP
ncbi:MerR family transcriptional regulator [Natronosporangium hydrolyticum]|uniref:MerR family transcriptional regulator n=1 Tax=Natronosporangium hydrolyticum TaxID=2811111 RepID=A0A895YIB8_9ACTN|nr:MerR family transcriptional regulator [Natronosporangium hydrolyticum]QSB15279.1 MerR family transcriptional regulator [Natronosporangium hydrolyticum]